MEPCEVIADYDSCAEADFLRVSQGTVKAKKLGKKGWQLVVETPAAEAPVRVTLTARGWEVLRLLALRGGGRRLVRAGDSIELVVPADGLGWFFLCAPFPEASVYDYQPKTLFKLANNTPEKAMPIWFYEPIDADHEFLHWQAMSFRWNLSGIELPSRDEMLQRRDRIMKEIPDLVVLGAHMGHLEDDLARLGETLDEHPNFYVEMGVRHVYLGLQPHTARKFHIKYQDRILFGQDGAINAWQYRQYFRFMETDDDQITIRAHEPKIFGLNLPDQVLKKIYYGNAARLMPKVKERLLALHPDLEFPE